MALNINAPNFAGMASQGGGNMNLANPGALGLQALQQNQAAVNAQRAAAIERMQIQQQGALGLGNQQIQRQQLAQQYELAKNQENLERQKVAQQGSQFDQSLQSDKMKMAMQDSQFGRSATLDERRQGSEEKKIAMEIQQREMAKLLDEKKETIKEKGAFASYGVLAMKGAKTPEEAQQIRTEIAKEALTKGIISKEEYAAASKMPISQFTNSLMFKVMQYGNVKDLQDMYEINNPKEKEGAAPNVIINADGSMEINQAPTKAVETEVQKDINSKEKDLRTIGYVLKNFDEDYLTTKGQAGIASSKYAEKLKGIPIVEQAADYVAGALTGKNPEERSDLLQNSTQFSNDIEQFFNKYKHDITGAAAAEKEIQQIRKSVMNGEMSPSEFKGAVQQILRKTIGDLDYNKYVLGKGIDISPNIVSQYKSMPQYKDWSEEKIKRAIAASGAK